jgi:AraC-like DNA-binding protein
VEEAKRRLKDPGLSNMTIQGIAFDSGFNSKATFNTAFNKFAGMTPSAYKKLP